MFGNSRIVTSNQQGMHPDLLRNLARHTGSVFRKPLASHTEAAFSHLMDAWREGGQPPLVLDAACGTGESSRRLALRHPDCLVVGVDQSAHRLDKGPGRAGSPGNLLLLRADVVDIWRLLAAGGVRLHAHYLLYPNPWPRKHHLQRRWHGHPAFPLLPQLGGRIECRSNWQVYVQEFAAALGALTGEDVQARPWRPLPGALLTPFEEKYLASGHALWRCGLAMETVRPAAPVLP